jgi:hypothetical protein
VFKGALNYTPFVDKNKIVISSFSLGSNKNNKIKSPIFFGDLG